MGVQIQEPDVDRVTLEDWQKLLFRTTFQGSGFMFIDLENMFGSGIAIPCSILKGSCLEINGAFYTVQADEYITFSFSSNDAQKTTHYVYALPSGETVSFNANTNMPTFSPQKGGWYSGNNRAVCKMTVEMNDDGILISYNKVILDSERAMYEDNPLTA